VAKAVQDGVEDRPGRRLLVRAEPDLRGMERELNNVILEFFFCMKPKDHCPFSSKPFFCRMAT
jgi:hypothetical protein